jgi:hypothetical protein
MNWTADRIDAVPVSWDDSTAVYFWVKNEKDCYIPSDCHKLGGQEDLSTFKSIILGPNFPTKIMRFQSPGLTAPPSTSGSRMRKTVTYLLIVTNWADREICPPSNP